MTVPEIQALIEINHSNSAKAIEIMKVALPYDHANLSALLMRGNAYLQGQRGKEAEREFQNVLSLKNFAPAAHELSLAQLGLARAYALQGEKTKSRTAYQDFLGLWKDAEPEIPILRQAKAEYARLQ